VKIKFNTILVVGLLLIYGPLMIGTHLINYDDPMVVKPLEQVSTLQDYFVLRDQLKIMDLQPIRDLSLVIDWKLTQLFGFDFFRFSSLLIYLGFCWIVVRICKQLFWDLALFPAFSPWMLLPFFWSPIQVSSVVWVTARKHLLAGFFIAAATDLLLRYVRKKSSAGLSEVGILFLYIAACAAQPIIVGWPFVAFLLAWNWSDRRLGLREGLLFLSLVVSGVYVVYANQSYYNTAYSIQTIGLIKSQAWDVSEIGSSVLALGRYVFQMLVPFFPTPTSYHPASWQTASGFVCLCLALVAIFYSKKSERSSLGLFLICFFLLLAPVVVRISNIFGSDTYLLSASIFYVIFLLYLFREWLDKRAARLSVVLLSFMSLGFSIHYAHQWRSTRALFSYAYAVEPSPFNGLNYAHELNRLEEYRLALELGLKVRAWAPEQRGTAQVISYAVYQIHAGQPRVGIEALNQTWMESIWFYFYLAGFYEDLNEKELARSTLERAISDQRLFVDDNVKQVEWLFARVYRLCNELTPDQNCRESLRKLGRHWLLTRYWSQESFITQLKSQELEARFKNEKATR
jgi:hypothetical protein